jgi:flagellar assembly protein FliH
MKLLPKVNPDDSLAAWNPPDLNIESSIQPQSSNKEQVLAIFKKDDEPNADQKGKETKKQLHSKANGKSFSSWQPGLLDQQAAGINEEDWAFLDVSDTPFDRSWKVQSPNGFVDEISPRENEIAKLLERARLQAEEIILAAQAEADDILLQAQSEIDVQKKEGFEQGQKEARAEIEDAMKAVRKMAEDIEAWKTDLLSQSEHILFEMLKDIARKMFGDGVKLDAHALHTNLNRIMENAHGLGALKIFLNPNDARLLDSSWDEQQMLSLGEQVKIIPSGNVLPGGCLIKGNIGTIDARVETQLGAILKTFDEPDASDN